LVQKSNNDLLRKVKKKICHSSSLPSPKQHGWYIAQTSEKRPPTRLWGHTNILKKAKIKRQLLLSSLPAKVRAYGSNETRRKL